jgi:hypothetical protein
MEKQEWFACEIFCKKGNMTGKRRISLPDGKDNKNGQGSTIKGTTGMDRGALS